MRICLNSRFIIQKKMSIFFTNVNVFHEIEVLSYRKHLHGILDSENHKSNSRMEYISLQNGFKYTHHNYHIIFEFMIYKNEDDSKSHRSNRYNARLPHILQYSVQCYLYHTCSNSVFSPMLSFLVTKKKHLHFKCTTTTTTTTTYLGIPG